MKVMQTCDKTQNRLLCKLCKLWLNELHNVKYWLRLTYLCICNLMRSKTLHLNTSRSEINSDPNTPLNAKLHYDKLMQADADSNEWSNNFNYSPIAQIQLQINTNNSITQFHKSKWQNTLNNKLKVTTMNLIMQ